MTDPQIQAPEGALRQVLRELETARDYITKSLEGAKEAYRGYPDRWAAEERDLADIDAAIAAARAALAAQTDLDLRDDVIATLRGQLAEVQALCDERGRKLYGAAGQAPAEGDLTDERLLHLVDTHVGEPNPRYLLSNRDWINFGRAVIAEDRAALAAQPQAPAVFDAPGFHAWVLANLPDDTIIGSSSWWAEHLTAWAGRFVKAAEGDASLREAFVRWSFMTGNIPGSEAQAKFIAGDDNAFHPERQAEWVAFQAGAQHQPKGLTLDSIYAAWHAIGADIAGLEWAKFAERLATVPSPAVGDGS